MKIIKQDKRILIIKKNYCLMCHDVITIVRGYTKTGIFNKVIDKGDFDASYTNDSKTKGLINTFDILCPACKPTNDVKI